MAARRPRQRGRAAHFTSADVDALLRRFLDAWEAELPDQPVRLGAEHLAQTVIGFKVAVPHDSKIGASQRIDLVQRDAATGQVVGGIGVHIHVVAQPEGDQQ